MPEKITFYSVREIVNAVSLLGINISLCWPEMEKYKFFALFTKVLSDLMSV